jgi:acyl carrier protein
MRPDVERAVRAEIRRALEQQGKPAAAVSAGDSLSDTLGLTSLDVVELIVALNARLAVDPFKQRAFTEIQTVGDLVSAYGLPPAAGAPDSDLAASRRRAETRRDRWRARA